MAQRPDEDWRADQVMKAYPETVSVFLALKIGCVGCYLKRFCTLKEVAAAHNLPLDDVLEKILEIVPISDNRGE